MNQRGQTRSPRSGKRPLPHRHAEQRGAGGEASAGPGLHTQAGWRAGPLGARPGPRDPPPPRLGREPGNGHPPPLAARAGTRVQAGHQPRTEPMPSTQGFPGPWTAAPGLAGEEKGLRAARPEGRRVRARRLPSCAPLGPPHAALGLPRPPPERPRLPPARLAGGPAGSAPRPPRQVLAQPRAPPRACALADSGLGAGRGGAGGAAGGASEGGAPFTAAAPGLRGSPSYGTGLPFHRRGD